MTTPEVAYLYLAYLGTYVLETAKQDIPRAAVYLKNTYTMLQTVADDTVSVFSLAVSFIPWQSKVALRLATSVGFPRDKVENCLCLANFPYGL